MPEGRCQNEACRRLIYDTEKLEELQDVIVCQHCGHPNVFRVHAEPELYVRAEPRPKTPARKRRKA